MFFFFIPDTFQALIQYPDVVTAQAAKLVSSDHSDEGFRKYVLQCCQLLIYITWFEYFLSKSQKLYLNRVHVFPKHIICRFAYMECSFCRLIRRRASFLESLVGRVWQSPTNWRSFIRWSLYECSLAPPSVTEASCYCDLFCVFMARVRYNLEQRVFIYDCYVKTNSYKSCRRKCRHKFPVSSAWTATELLHIRRYKITVVPEIKHVDYEKREVL
jgi:hypothetical protein